MSASNGNAVDLAGEHVGSGVTPADPCRATGCKPPIRSLGAAVAKLEDRTSACGVADPCGFRCDEGLKVDDVEQCRLGELGMKDRALDSQEGFMGKNRASFRDGIDVQLQAQLGEISKEGLLKHAMPMRGSQRIEVLDLPFRKMKIAEPFQRGAKPGRNGVAASERKTAEEEMKNAFLLRLARLPVSGSHGELVKIGLEC